MIAYATFCFIVVDLYTILDVKNKPSIPLDKNNNTTMTLSKMIIVVPILFIYIKKKKTEHKRIYFYYVIHLNHFSP